MILTIGLISVILSIGENMLNPSAMPVHQYRGASRFPYSLKYGIIGFMGRHDHGGLIAHKKHNGQQAQRESLDHPTSEELSTTMQNLIVEKTNDQLEGVTALQHDRVKSEVEVDIPDSKKLRSVETGPVDIQTSGDNENEILDVGVNAEAIRHGEANDLIYYPVNCQVSPTTVTEHCALAQMTADKFKRAYESYCAFSNTYVKPSHKTCEEQAADIIASKPTGYLPSTSSTVGRDDNVQKDAQELLRGLHSYKHVAKNISRQHENNICSLHNTVGFECSKDIICEGEHVNQTAIVGFCSLFPYLEDSIYEIENFIYQHTKLMTDEGVTPEYDEDIDVNPVICEEYGTLCAETLRPYTLAGLYNAYQQMVITEEAYVTLLESLEVHC